MKRAHRLMLLALIGVTAACSQEMAVHGNGLIYDAGTITALRHIADSLNLRFKSCDPNPPCFSLYQAKAHAVHFAGNPAAIRRLRMDLDKGLPLEVIQERHKAVMKEIHPAEPIMKQQYVDYRGNTLWHVHYLPDDYPTIPTGGATSYDDHTVRGRWAYTYYEPYDSEPARVTAYLFTEDFRQRRLPESYARLVQYVDCLVDTTTQVYVEVPPSAEGQISDIMARIDSALGLGARPERPKNRTRANTERYFTDRLSWENRRDSLLSTAITQPAFRALVVREVQLAIARNAGSEELELLADSICSPNDLLELKRRRQPEGTCGMDSRPRRHAVQIARLAAQNLRWDVFLRAHLDIMNDRFERISDGSYAWKERRTYIAEVEALGINVPDLVFGMTLLCDNFGKNHYTGSAARLGRALSESRDTVLFEQRITAMIHDEQLDDFNRMLMFALYANHAYNLPPAEGARRITALKKNAASFPTYLRDRIEKMGLPG